MVVNGPVDWNFIYFFLKTNIRMPQFCHQWDQSHFSTCKSCYKQMEYAILVRHDTHMYFTGMLNEELYGNKELGDLFEKINDQI